MTQKKYTLQRYGTTVDLSGEQLFLKHDGEVEVAVHHHPDHGNILFIDGEAQISCRDFKMYHDAMLSFVKPGARILVIGDGDGGFCSKPAYDITQVEMSEVVREAAVAAYGVTWPTPETEYHRLYSMTLSEYLTLTEQRPDGDYDAIFLAITDDFNADRSNFFDVMALWNKKLRPGGVMVSQVGCVNDPEFASYDQNHDELEQALYATHAGLVDIIESQPYIHVFHSQHVFRALYKEKANV